EERGAGDDHAILEPAESRRQRGDPVEAGGQTDHGYACIKIEPTGEGNGQELTDEWKLQTHRPYPARRTSSTLPSRSCLPHMGAHASEKARVRASSAPDPTRSGFVGFGHAGVGGDLCGHRSTQAIRTKQKARPFGRAFSVG